MISTKDIIAINPPVNVTTFLNTDEVSIHQLLTQSIIDASSKLRNDLQIPPIHMNLISSSIPNIQPSSKAKSLIVWNQSIVQAQPFTPQLKYDLQIPQFEFSSLQHDVLEQINVLLQNAYWLVRMGAQHEPLTIDEMFIERSISPFVHLLDIMYMFNVLHYIGCPSLQQEYVSIHFKCEQVLQAMLCSPTFLNTLCFQHDFHPQIQHPLYVLNKRNCELHYAKNHSIWSYHKMFKSKFSTEPYDEFFISIYETLIKHPDVKCSELPWVHSS